MSSIDFSAAKPILGKDYEERVGEAKKAIDAVRFVTTGVFDSSATMIASAGSGNATITLGSLNGKATTGAAGNGIFTGPGQPDVSVGSPFSIQFTANTAILVNTQGTQIWAGIGAQTGLPPTLSSVTFS